MARWRLLNPHYLNVPGTEWERVEVSRATGKQARVRFPVCRLLNPDDPNDQNHPGECVVAHNTKGHKNDIVFVGPPTPDMEPLDEEAEQISASWKDRWSHPINDLPIQGDYSQSMLSKFESELSAIVKKTGDNVSISAAEFAELKKQVAELTKQNAKLERQAAK